jgi:hypothetical protein
MGQVTGDPNKPAAVRAPAAAPIDDQIDDEPAATAPAATPAASAEGASRAQDILAMIRNRQK